MSTTTSRRPWLTPAMWVLKGLLALLFLVSGGAKLAGAERMVSLFEQIGWGQGFRLLTGSLEVGGALLLAWPRASCRGALILACVMIGAVFTHLAVIGGSPVPAALLFVGAALFVWIDRPRRSDFATRSLPHTHEPRT